MYPRHPEPCILSLSCSVLKIQKQDRLVMRIQHIVIDSTENTGNATPTVGLAVGAQYCTVPYRQRRAYARYGDLGGRSRQSQSDASRPRGRDSGQRTGAAGTGLVVVGRGAYTVRTSGPRTSAVRALLMLPRALAPAVPLPCALAPGLALAVGACSLLPGACAGPARKSATQLQLRPQMSERSGLSLCLTLSLRLSAPGSGTWLEAAGVVSRVSTNSGYSKSLRWFAHMVIDFRFFY
jgi:hypothetical protein